MAKDESKRLNPLVPGADKAAFAALQAMTDYAPVNPAYSTAAVATAHSELLAAQTAETQTAAAAARDNATAKEWNFHNVMLVVKDQAIAQYGRNSNQVQSLGRKKPSEYKPRTRKAKPPQG
jgi:hypothetical protein